MKTTRILWAAAILAAWTAGQTTPAPGWTLDQLNPFHRNEANRKPDGRTVNKPSPLEKIDASTRAFFSNLKDTLTPRKPAARKSPLKPRVPWVRNPKPQRTDAAKKPQRTYTAQKPSWLNSLFRREEPKPPETMDEFMRLERPQH